MKPSVIYLNYWNLHIYFWYWTFNSFSQIQNLFFIFIHSIKTRKTIYLRQYRTRKLRSKCYIYNILNGCVWRAHDIYVVKMNHGTIGRVKILRMYCVFIFIKGKLIFRNRAFHFSIIATQGSGQGTFRHSLYFLSYTHVDACA